MKKILELLLCLVALIALLVVTKYSDNVQNVDTEKVASQIESQNTAAESVAMLGAQE